MALHRLIIVLAIPVAAILCSCGSNQVAGSPKVAPPSKSPFKRTLIGAWIKTQSKDYVEGVNFFAGGKFVRWGREPEGGWQTPGEYKETGSKVHFKCIAPSLDNFGKDDDAVEGDADLVWISDDKLEFHGQGRTLALTRKPEKGAATKT